jgi:O-antigen biosynthesis protein
VKTSVRLRAQQAKDLRLRIGARGTAKFVVRRALGWRPARFPGYASGRKGSVETSFAYLFESPSTSRRCNDPGVPNTINWYIPDFGPGSGGHRTILRFARLLSDRGFESRFVLVGPSQLWSSQDLHKALENFGEGAYTCFVGAASAPPAEFHLATGWQTVASLPPRSPGIRRGYFVQDFEPDFYGAGTRRALAESTYQPDLPAITAGGWLAETLHEKYGMRTQAVGFAAELDIYRPRVRREKDIVRVAFYARPPTERRCFELGVLALEEVHRRRPEVEFLFVGWDVPASNCSFPFHNGGTISTEELADVYSQADAVLVLSATNLSLVPLESMACGTPLVSNRGAWVEWLLNDDNSFLADSNPHSIADAVLAALEKGVERDRRIKAGLKLARSLDWGVHADTYAAWLLALRNDLD